MTSAAHLFRYFIWTAGATRQPVIDFPSRRIGKRERRFREALYENCEWLEYSVARDAAYCYCCRHKVCNRFFFHLIRVQRLEETFGHNEKENALLKHSTSSVHKSAMCAWREYHRSAARGQTIAHDVMVSAKRRLEEDIGENRYYVKTLIEILLLCAKQGI